ncbi:Protein mak11 [Amphichorda felina]
MAKRKRQAPLNGEPAKAPEAPTSNKKQKAATGSAKPSSSAPTQSRDAIRVVAGSYDGNLHGLTLTIGPKGKDKKQQVEFTDTFLLKAHTMSIRCVAISPPSAPTPNKRQNVILASGSADSKINLYSLSVHPPKERPHDLLRNVAKRPIVEDPYNRPLVNLEHHESAVTALQFPTRSKLMSAGEDSKIFVTRTRDWAPVGVIKAPITKAMGRPSGDTAAHDGTPQGVNDFAVHPSMMLMMSVSKGERKVRPWNLMTGRRAKALNYERELLQQVGEGRHSSGDGKKLVWGNVGGEDEFAVGFDRDVVVFTTAGEPKCKVMPTTRTKIHQVNYVSVGQEDDEAEPITLLAVSTEDGRIVFTSTKDEHITKIKDAKEGMAPGVARVVAHLGGKDSGVTGRIKDFMVVQSAADAGTVYVIAGGSDGVIRVWAVGVEELRKACEKPREEAIGSLIGTCETDNRVTCMTGYLMIPRPEGVMDSDEELEALDAEEDESSGSDESDDE